MHIRQGFTALPPCVLAQVKVDVACLLLGSLSELHTHEAALACLQSVRAALVPDGLFILEMGNPVEYFDGTHLAVSDMWTHTLLS